MCFDRVCVITVKLYWMLQRKLAQRKVSVCSMSRHQNAGQNHDAANKSFENISILECLKTTVTNKNYIHKQIKSELNIIQSVCLPVSYPKL
jgi:hypothetical protein